MTWRAYCFGNSLARFADVADAKEMLQFHLKVCPIVPLGWGITVTWQYDDEGRAWHALVDGKFADHVIAPSMKRADIPDEHVIDLAQRWRDGRGAEPGVMAALMSEGVPRNLAMAKVLHLVDRGLLDFGVSPYCAWPTGKTSNVRVLLRALHLKHGGMEFQAAMLQATTEITANRRPA